MTFQIAPGTYNAIVEHIAKLHHPDQDVIANAAYELGCFGHDAEEAIEPLIDLLTSNVSEIRAAATAAIGRIRGKAEISVPALARAVQDPNVLVRRYAAAGLTLCQRDDLIRFNALPAVSTAANDEDHWVRSAAAGFSALQ